MIVNDMSFLNIKDKYTFMHCKHFDLLDCQHQLLKSFCSCLICIIPFPSDCKKMLFSFLCCCTMHSSVRGVIHFPLSFIYICNSKNIYTVVILDS